MKNRAFATACRAMRMGAAAWLVTAATGVHAQDLSAGQKIATQGTASGVPACIACHGEAGQGNADIGMPRLAGTGIGYLQEQLAAFADGKRPSDTMEPFAKLLTEAERSALAQYFSSLPPPQGARTSDPADPAPSDTGAWLATRGRWADGVPACASCHGPGGAGVGAAFPPLAGQPAAYIEQQLQNWKAGKRPPGVYGVMPQAVASKLSDADIHAVALYYAQATDTPAATGAQPVQPAAAAAKPNAASGAFEPPPESAMPTGEFGKMVKLGEQIFLHTDQYASQYTGNVLKCTNCHLDAGRRAESSPAWAAFVTYPRYRGKEKHVLALAERLQGCFRYSMNGKAPPLGDPVLIALESYAFWLATGAPVGDMTHSGYQRLKPPPQKADYARGEQVYQQQCALCHGASGQGQGSQGHTVFPPLWGSRSFNWGAGMTGIDVAAAFIKANMPLGMGGSLTDQQAWDVATFIDSQDRPQDPRFEGSVEQTRAKYSNSPYSMYGQTVNGRQLGRP